MNSFYRVIDSIKDAVSAEPFNHQVTFGDIADIDLQKQSLFPLCHIMINNATITENIVQQNITIFLMDLVDVSNSEDTSLFLGNDKGTDMRQMASVVFDEVLDLDSDQYISLLDFCSGLRAMKTTLGTPEVHRIFQKADTNNDGTMTRGEFIDFIAQNYPVPPPGHLPRRLQLGV